MTEHRASIAWTLGDSEFSYEAYPRTHRTHFGGGAALDVSAAPEYRGDASKPNPEELLVSAAASCHMMTFLAIAARKKIVVLSYEDSAVGYLEPNEERRLAITRIELRPKITFQGPAPSTAEMDRLHDLAHRNCFIAQSLRATVTVLPSDPSPGDS